MNQRIAVRAIIRKDDKTLLLRRASGRPSIIKKYELPGGRVAPGEQPIDALRRHVTADTGLKLQTTQLFDVVTYDDYDDRGIQYAVIVFLASAAPEFDKVMLSQSYDHYIWKKKAAMPHDEVTESTKLLLELAPHQASEVVSLTAHEPRATESLVVSQAIIYSDGGSRGNPGPSAAGFVVLDRHEQVIAEGGEYLGITTNNQAEYHGVRLGLEQALVMQLKVIDFRIDSMLVVNQMNGLYKIKNRELWPIHEHIKALAAQFERVTFTHVRREFNQLADGMVNKILNQHADEGAKLL